MTSLTGQAKLDYDRAWRAKNIEKVRASALKYYYAHHTKSRIRGRKVHLRVKYNMTEDQYQELFNSQQGKCVICGQEETTKGRHKKPQRLAVDHCHKTGKVRGLLCFMCNNMLGSSRDSIETLTKAIEYLKKNQ